MACQNVNVALEVDSGDPDLFGLEDSTPIITENECRACALCSSRGGTSESCPLISTVNNTFRVMVYAFGAYGNGNITFENVLSVESYGK